MRSEEKELKLLSMNRIKGNEVFDKEDLFPKNFLLLISQSDIQNVTEGLIVLLHSCLLEVGFIPKDVKVDVYNCMPEGWKSNGIFKIQYLHKKVPEKLCWVTWVPMADNLVVQGTIDNTESENTVHLSLPPKKYINSQSNILDHQNLFCQTKALSRLFKDEFCYSLLALLEESANCKPSFGFRALIDELKLLIMKELPVESVVALSAVNSDFHKKANSTYVWRVLFTREFGSIGPVADSTMIIDWKEMYKAEYRKRKKARFRPLPLYVHPFHYPPIHPAAAPSFDPGTSLFQYMDPSIQENFPQLRRGSRPSHWMFPAGQYRNIPHTYLLPRRS